MAIASSTDRTGIATSSMIWDVDVLGAGVVIGTGPEQNQISQRQLVITSISQELKKVNIISQSINKQNWYSFTYRKHILLWHPFDCNRSRHFPIWTSTPIRYCKLDFFFPLVQAGKISQQRLPWNAWQKKGKIAFLLTKFCSISAVFLDWSSSGVVVKLVGVFDQYDASKRGCCCSFLGVCFASLLFRLRNRKLEKSNDKKPYVRGLVWMFVRFCKKAVFLCITGKLCNSFTDPFALFNRRNLGYKNTMFSQKKN